MDPHWSRPAVTWPYPYEELATYTTPTNTFDFERLSSHPELYFIGEQTATNQPIFEFFLIELFAQVWSSHFIFVILCSCSNFFYVCFNKILYFMISNASKPICFILYHSQYRIFNCFICNRQKIEIYFKNWTTWKVYLPHITHGLRNIIFFYSIWSGYGELGNDLAHIFCATNLYYLYASLVGCDDDFQFSIRVLSSNF